MNFNKLLIRCLMAFLLVSCFDALAMNIGNGFLEENKTIVFAKKIHLDPTDEQESPLPHKSCAARAFPWVAYGLTMVLGGVAIGGLTWYLGGFVYHFFKIAVSPSP